LDLEKKEKKKMFVRERFWAKRGFELILDEAVASFFVLVVVVVGLTGGHSRLYM
jgi:hypothetical protein